MIRALFFDLDDTLCNAGYAWKKAVEETFRFFLSQHPHIQAHQLKQAWDTVHQALFQELKAGRLTMAAVRDLRFQHTLQVVGVLDVNYGHELNTMLSRTQLSHLELFDDVVVLESVHGKYHLGIVTNGAADGHPDSQRTKIEHLGLSGRVDAIWISDEVGYRKPHVEIFEKACVGAGIVPQEAIFVGDSVSNDIVGANRAGMVSILIERSSQPSLLAHGDERPDYKVSSLLEIPVILGELKA